MNNVCGWVFVVIGMFGWAVDMLVGKCAGGPSLVQIGLLFLILHRVERLGERDRPQ